MEEARRLPMKWIIIRILMDFKKKRKGIFPLFFKYLCELVHKNKPYKHIDDSLKSYFVFPTAIHLGKQLQTFR